MTTSDKYANEAIAEQLNRAMSVVITAWESNEFLSDDDIANQLEALCDLFDSPDDFNKFLEASDLVESKTLIN